MKTKKSTTENLNLSDLVLGLWRLPDVDENEVLNIVRTALDEGITSIDQADIYGNYQSQLYFGRALKREKSLRKKIQIISKTGIIIPGPDFSKTGIGFYTTSKKHIMASVEKSLEDMGTDYLDVLLIHRPDVLLQPEELEAVFEKLKKQGKVLHFGVSNFIPSQFEMLQKRIDTPLVTNQFEFSLLHLDPLFDGTFDNCIQHGISPMIWSPMAGGNLFTSKANKTNAIRAVLTDIANELGGATIDQVALAWIMKHPSNPKTIIGTLKPGRIKLSAEALKLELSREQWYRILIVAQEHPMA